MSTAPSEYVIVKREPTAEMVEAGHDTGVTSRPGDVWAAMLSASPRPETVLTDEDLESAHHSARQSYARWMSAGPCGQMCMPEDDPQWHVAHALESDMVKFAGTVRKYEAALRATAPKSEAVAA